MKAGFFAYPREKCHSSLKPQSSEGSVGNWVSSRMIEFTVTGLCCEAGCESLNFCKRRKT
jgi:hypothetical protein